MALSQKLIISVLMRLLDLAPDLAEDDECRICGVAECLVRV